MQRKVCGFDENDMKTYSCRRALIYHYILESLPLGYSVVNDFNAVYKVSQKIC